MPRPLRLAAVLLVLALLAGCGGDSDDGDEIGTVRPAPPLKYGPEDHAVTATAQPWTVTGRPLPRRLRGRWEMRVSASDVDSSPASSSAPGRWQLSLHRYRYLLRRPDGIEFQGTAAVEGRELHVQYYERCQRARLPQMQGRFSYVLTGGRLRFDEVLDSCGDGNRAFVLTSKPWRPRR